MSRRATIVVIVRVPVRMLVLCVGFVVASLQCTSSANKNFVMDFDGYENRTGQEQFVSTANHLSTRFLRPGRKQTAKPWFTASHKRLHKQRNRMFALAKRTNTVQDWVAYRVVRNALSSSLKRSKADYFNQLCSRIDSEKNSYRWWAQAKKLANITSQTANLPTLTDESGEAPCDASKAEKLADTFVRQFSPNPSFDLTAALLTPSFSTLDHEFDLPRITEEEVFRKLRTLPARKSTGGLITNRILKETAPVITQSLCQLLNLSLRLGQLPVDWKTATVIPIFKNN